MLQQALSSLGGIGCYKQSIWLRFLYYNLWLIWAKWSHYQIFAIGQKEVWIVAATPGYCSIIETLLCIEAGDNMDPGNKRYTNPNRELLAQGVGNALSGLIGGLPMTSVVVRTTANITSGARPKCRPFFMACFAGLCIGHTREFWIKFRLPRWQPSYWWLVTSLRPIRQRFSIL